MNGVKRMMDEIEEIINSFKKLSKETIVLKKADFSNIFEELTEKGKGSKIMENNGTLKPQAQQEDSVNYPYLHLWKHKS